MNGQLCKGRNISLKCFGFQSWGSRVKHLEAEFRARQSGSHSESAPVSSVACTDTLSISMPQFPHRKMGIMIPPIS